MAKQPTPRKAASKAKPVAPPEPVKPIRQGPEDALGTEPTMHDYSKKLGAGYKPHVGEVAQEVAPVIDG